MAKLLSSAMSNVINCLFFYFGDKRLEIVALFLKNFGERFFTQILYVFIMAWRSHGRTNLEMVRNLKGKFQFIGYVFFFFI